MNLQTQVDLERVYFPLLGASECRVGGAEGTAYEVIAHWFQRCRIIDPQSISLGEFRLAYLRLSPNLTELSLVQFIQLMGILSRQGHRPLQELLARFESVRDTLVEEVVAARRDAGGEYK